MILNLDAKHVRILNEDLQDRTWQRRTEQLASFLRVFVKVFLSLLLVAVVSLTAYLIRLAQEADRVTAESMSATGPASSALYDRNGELLHTLSSTTYKTDLTDYSAVPAALADAFLAAWDADFRSRHGIDLDNFLVYSVSHLSGQDTGQFHPTLTQSVVRSRLGSAGW